MLLNETDDDPLPAALEGVNELPAGLQLADWRRRVGQLYREIQTLAPEPGWRHWRQTRDLLFRHHPQSPLSPDQRMIFEGLPVFPYDPAQRYLATVRSSPENGDEKWDIGPEGPLRVSVVGRTEGLEAALGGELTLYWIGGYGGGLYLPFRDTTAGRSTFGGGRYLIDTIKGADLGLSDGRLVLDFNFAYHPSCGYSPAWMCPLAPAENVVPNPIQAGERL